MSDSISVFQGESPRIRLIPVDRPWLWLMRGWSDLSAAPRVSLAYGLVFVAISVLLTLGLAVLGLLYMLLPLAAGFMLIAPILAVGLYETSRRLAAGLPVTLASALGAWRRNRGSLGSFGLILMFLHLVWVRVATLLYPLFFEGPNPSLGELPNILFFSPMSLPFLVTGTLIGAALAALAFAMSVVSIPMLVDRDVGVVVAIATSVAAVRHNWRPMALWAALIVGFTALGMAVFFLGLAVVLPLIGHASWHCYKDVVEAP